jgi:HlyD family secretion protein
MSKVKKYLAAALPFIKKRYLYIAGALVLVGIIAMIATGGKKNAQEYTEAQKGDVVSEISVTGTVKPARSLDMAFERSGRIRSIHVAVGDKVAEGQTLVSLDNADLQAQAAQAQAQYDAQAARLEELVRGARSEDLAVTQTQLDNARANVANVQNKADADLASAYSGAYDAIKDAYTKSDDAVRNQISDLFLYGEENNPTVTFDSLNAQARIDAGSYRVQARDALAAWGTEIPALPMGPSGYPAIDAALNTASTRLNLFLSLFSSLQDALNSASGLNSAELASYRTKIAAGRTAVITALTAVNRQRQAIATQRSVNTNLVASAKDAVAQLEKQLALKQAGSPSEQIAAQQAQVDQAQANVSYQQSQLAKTVIRAPFSGVVTKIPLEKGNLVQPGVTVVSIIGSGKYQIESNISESDVAKVKLGDKARVTLDAYGQDVIFSANVAQIDLSETQVGGVSTYKTTLQINEDDARIKPGMTANVDILNAKKENVLFVPTRDIIAKNGRKYVEILRDSGDKKTEEVEIKAGLKGSDGRTEVLEGASEGDKIVVQ